MKRSKLLGLVILLCLLGTSVHAEYPLRWEAHEEITGMPYEPPMTIQHCHEDIGRFLELMRLKDQEADNLRRAKDVRDETIRVQEQTIDHLMRECR